MNRFINHLRSLVTLMAALLLFAVIGRKNK